MLALSLITSGKSMHAMLNVFISLCSLSKARNAHQMPETIKQKAIQLEPVIGSYKARKVFPHISCGEVVQLQPLKLLSQHMHMTCL